MKKFSTLLILLGIYSLVSPVFAQTEDRILDFNSNINVSRNTEIDIDEKITFQPSSYIERHGLEWTIPYIYSANALRRPTQLDINSVQYYPLNNPTDITYNKYTRSDDNGWATLRIGDPNILITQPHVYIIDYTLKYSAISFFDTHEELFLNIIGPGWKMPIEKASATLVLPAEVPEAICFTGPDGSTESNCTIEIEGNTVKVKPTVVLNPYEGYTVVIKQPLGTFEDTRKEQARLILIANSGILLPIPVGIFLFVFLRNYKKGKQYTVIPTYEPPEQMDALKSSILMKNTSLFTTKYISALLIEMAVKGYCKVREYKKRKYELVKLKEYPSEPEHTRHILDSIFVYGDTVPLSKLTNFFTTSSEAYNICKKQLLAEGYMSRNRRIVKTVLTISSAVLFFLSIMSSSIYIAFAAIGTLLGVMISLIMVIIFSRGINTKSDKGNQIFASLMGLKMYIKTAEKQRIEFHNNPDKYKEVFEKLLPYAMIFGLEKKWAEQFKDIYSTSPQWYEGYNSSFDTLLFNNSLSTFNRSVFASSAPSNYGSSGGFRSSGWSSGGSGFGGGGSSGGGGGGSGGGGW